MSRFVKPETVVLRLSGDDTITVRKRLNAGEARARTERWTEQVEDPDTHDLKLRPLLTKAGLATITAYLLEWTLTDDAGRLVDVRGATIADLEAILNNLEADTLNEIREAIEKHEAAADAERAEQKKTAGLSASDPISRSLVAVAGATNG
jgi:hypothetical protein